MGGFLVWGVFFLLEGGFKRGWVLNIKYCGELEGKGETLFLDGCFLYFWFFVITMMGWERLAFTIVNRNFLCFLPGWDSLSLRK